MVAQAEEARFQARRIQLAKEKMAKAQEARFLQAEQAAQSHAEEMARQDAVVAKEDAKKALLLKQRFEADKLRLEREAEKEAQAQKSRHLAAQSEQQKEAAWARAEEGRIAREAAYLERKQSFVTKRAAKIKRINEQKAEEKSQIEALGAEAERQRMRAEAKRERQQQEKQEKMRSENAAQRAEQEARAREIQVRERTERETTRAQREHHLKDVEARQKAAELAANKERSRKKAEDFKQRSEVRPENPCPHSRPPYLHPAGGGFSAGLCEVLTHLLAVMVVQMREAKQKKATDGALQRVQEHEVRMAEAATRAMELQEQAAEQKELAAERLRLSHVKKEAHIARLQRRREYQREQTEAKLQQKQEQLDAHQERRKRVKQRRKAAAQKFLMAELEMRKLEKQEEDAMRLGKGLPMLSPRPPPGGPSSSRAGRTSALSQRGSQVGSRAPGFRSERGIGRTAAVQKELAGRLACPALPQVGAMGDSANSVASHDMFERAQQWMIESERAVGFRKPTLPPGKKPGTKPAAPTHMKPTWIDRDNTPPRESGRGRISSDDDDSDMDDFDSDDDGTELKPSPLAILLEAAITDSKSKVGALTVAHMEAIDKDNRKKGKVSS